MRVQVTCTRPGCEKIFPTTSFRLARGQGRYCSRACFRLARLVHARVTQTCAHPDCGRPFQTDVHAVARGRGRYCSKACVDATWQGDGFARRFAEKVAVHAPDDPGGCDEWQGHRSSRGYGDVKVRWQRGTMRATHIAWQLAPDPLPIPAGHVVCHVCDNPTCVRNDDVGTYTIPGTDLTFPRRGHLWLGTHADNARDMVVKGRSPRGTHSASAVLTEALVWTARLWRKHEGVSYELLGRLYGVSNVAINNAVNGRTWRHVPFP